MASSRRASIEILIATHKSKNLSKNDPADPMDHSTRHWSGGTGLMSFYTVPPVLPDHPVQPDQEVPPDQYRFEWSAGSFFDPAYQGKFLVFCVGEANIMGKTEGINLKRNINKYLNSCCLNSVLKIAASRFKQNICI